MSNSLDKLNSLYKEKVRNPWAVAWAIVNDKSGKTNPLWADEVQALDADDTEGRKALAAKIAGGIENNPFSKSYPLYGGTSAAATDNVEDEEDDEEIEKGISPAAAALAGWFLGGDITRGLGQPTPAQQREFERQIEQAMRKKGRKLSKTVDNPALDKMKAFFNKSDASDTYVRKTPVENGVQAQETEIQKVLGTPPFAGARFDPSSHRWVKPENVGQTYAARGGKKRLRGSGTGAHQRSVSGHGKGRIRHEGAGAKGKGETHLSATRRKEGLRHGTGKKG
jgi:hypothetical protein